MLKAYFGMLSLHFIEKKLETLSMSIEIKIPKALKFSGEVLTLQHWVSQS